MNIQIERKGETKRDIEIGRRNVVGLLSPEQLSVGLQSLKDGRKPALVKVWINKPAMDFSDCEDGTPLQAWNVSKDWKEIKDEPNYKVRGHGSMYVCIRSRLSL